MSMERNDSTAAMASLAAYAEESDSDDEGKKIKSAIDSISDDEHDTPTPTPVPHPAPTSRPPSSLVVEDENSRSDMESTDTKKAKKRKPTRLVSYGADELEEEESSESEEEPSPETSVDRGRGVVEGKIMKTSLNVEQASSLSRSMLNKSFDEIELPPEPVAKCSKMLQEKIASLHERKLKEGLDLNRNIQNRVDFRNPSIYEKLIEFCGIDEKGTNYPPELYDPSIWGKESFYDALDKAQKLDKEKRDKERKERTKVEFVTATKKSSSKTEIVIPDEKKRKSKWDEPSQSAAGRIAEKINVNLTSMATGTKSTVILATGSIAKKPSK
ncbi:SAP30-binding protein-like isoform X2 [Mercenaria mercenaria]|nr:SAP30-binding protein-like isoform X2 [Mercenaria mercenaria]